MQACRDHRTRYGRKLRCGNSLLALSYVRVISFTAADSLGITVEMHNTLIKNVASRETTPLNAISVA
jgi:hypothetical protein